MIFELLYDKLCIKNYNLSLFLKISQLALKTVKKTIEMSRKVLKIFDSYQNLSKTII